MGTIAERREQDYLRYRESLIVDEQTWVAENLDAPLEKPLRYSYRNGELWSEQEQPLGPIFADSVDHYRRMAAENPALAFQYRRSLAEQREYQHMVSMARGEAPNTLVVVSPLPVELRGTSQNILGYQPRRGLGFIRVITRQDDGSISMWTHSIDRTDHPDVIDAIYAELGEIVDFADDALEHPVSRQISSRRERELLGDKLLRAADKALERVYGGQWFAGRNDSDRREAIAYVMSQKDLLYAHVDALIHVGPKSEIANSLRYDFAAAMRRRFEGNTQFSLGGDVATEMASAGQDAARRGETADGCGLSISASTSRELEQAGYKPARVEKPYVEGVCVACLRPTMVGGCSVCADCTRLSDQGVNLFDVRDKALKRKAAAEKLERLRAAKQSAERPAAAKRLTKSQLAMAKYGAFARLELVTVVGGVDAMVYDVRTGEKLGKL